MCIERLCKQGGLPVEVRIGSWDTAAAEIAIFERINSKVCKVGDVWLLADLTADRLDLAHAVRPKASKRACRAVAMPRPHSRSALIGPSPRFISDVDWQGATFG